MKYTLLTIIFSIGSLLLYAQCYSVSNVYTFDYNGHTYKVIKENKNWTEASSCAVADGGYLTHVNDLAEQNALFSVLTSDASIVEVNTLNQFSTSAVWIGGSDSQNEGSWIWDGDNDNNGVPFWVGGPNGSSVNGAYTNWGTNPAEPDNNVGGQDKLTLTIDSGHPNYGKWNDLTSNNSNLIYYVIEYNTILSVGESIWKDEIKVYPNPFRDFIFVENTSPFDIFNIEVFNNVGQQIFGIRGTQNNDTKIDLSELEPGIYHLHLLLDNGSRVRYKIIR